MKSHPVHCARCGHTAYRQYVPDAELYARREGYGTCAKCHGPMVRTVQPPRGRNAEALRHWEGLT